METDLEKNMLREAARIQEDCLYSAKGHFCAGALWSKIHLFLGIPTAALAAIAGASALSEFPYHAIIAGILSILVAMLSGVATFLNPSERALEHREAGNRYNAVRNRARFFQNIDFRAQEGDITDLTTRLRELGAERDKLNQDSPQKPGYAFRKAKKGIEQGEASYSADDSVLNH